MRVSRHPTNIRRMLESRVKQMAARKPLLAASLVSVQRRCGKPRCHCASGEKHHAHQLTYKVRGKTHTVYVPVDFTEEVRSWIDEHRRLKRLLQEISQLTLALVRSHAQERKRRRGRL
jgi:DNA-binding transcriptional regulator LsrR (DeoR family)